MHQCHDMLSFGRSIVGIKGALCIQWTVAFEELFRHVELFTYPILSMVTYSVVRFRLTQFSEN